MKNFFRLFVLLSLTVVYANAQTNAESFLNKMPGLPKDSCNITKTEVESLTQKVSALIDQTENEIDVLNEKANEKGHGNEEAAKEAAMQQMSQQYGLSQDEMNKMKSGKMSAAEKQQWLIKCYSSKPICRWVKYKTFRK